jgi:hypothetical protein
MTSFKYFVSQDSFVRQKFKIIVGALVLSGFVPVFGLLSPGGAPGPALVAGVLPFLLAVGLMVRPGVFTADHANPPAEERMGVALLLYLAPVLLLNVVYPLVSPALAAAMVEGVPLTFIVLASSVTVPWLAQAACLPIYRVLGDLLSERNMEEIPRRFFQSWPVIFVQSLPLIPLFLVPVWLMTGWSWSALLDYCVLCLLHLVFVQSLVLANVSARRGLWAAAWSAYAAALFLAPTLWWLPPVLGTATQVFAMRSGLRHIGVVKRLDVAVVGADLVRGLLLGAVLWADKFVLFLVTGAQFNVVVVFAAMLPAVVAYNFYFVHLAPGVDRALSGLHRDIAGAALSSLNDSSRRLVRVVDRSVLLTGAVAALLTVSVTFVLFWADAADASLAVSAATATWASMMLTLLTYELDFIGEKAKPQILGAAHLVFCVLAFLAVRLSGLTLGVAASYMLLGAVDFVLLGLAWVLYKHHWSRPEFTLFWRHATTW